MSNIINVKEERNVLAFDGEVLDIVANSTNFYLQFELDEEWKSSKFITVVFDFDGLKCHVELDEDYKCQIPQTNSSKILFGLVAEPDENSKLSSTILSLNVKASSDDTRENDLAYTSSHANLLGLIHKLQTGEGVSAEHAQNATNAENANFATVAGTSQTQVSLTGDETIAGVKNFTDRIQHNSNIIPDITEIAGENLVVNGNFSVNQRGKAAYIRNGTDIYTADRWGLFNGDGRFIVTTKKLNGQDEDNPTILCQWIDDSLSHLFGNTFTVSAYINGELKYKTVTLSLNVPGDMIINIEENEEYVFRLYIKSTPRIIGVQFLVENGKTIKIDKVKAEVGSYVSKFEARPAALETILCQKFYQSLRVFSVGVAASETAVYFFVPTPTTLKSAQNFSIEATPLILMDGEKFLPYNIHLFQVDHNGCIFYATGTGFTTNQGYDVVEGILYIEGDYYY